MTFPDFILANIERILVEWEAFARSIPAASNMDTEALRDHAEKMLRVIAADMKTKQSGAEQRAKSMELGAAHPEQPTDTASESHAAGRLAEGFAVNELLAEYRALRASVIRLWSAQSAGADPSALDELTRFNEAIDQAITEAVARYSEGVDHSRQMFLGILGHDLRSPLAAVLLSARYLLQDPDALDQGRLKAALRVERGALRMKQMIADLLDAARVRLGGRIPVTLEPNDLKALCQAAVDESSAAHPERVITFSSEGDLRAGADAVRIAQLLSNLIENALKHGSSETPVHVSAIGEGRTVMIAIHNTGSPISPSVQQTIFDPLIQVERPGSRPGEGLGLGLYIAQQIAKAHAGFITVSSDEINGTNFRVTLPRVVSSL